MNEALTLQDLKKINDWIQIRLSTGGALRDEQHKDLDTKKLLRSFVQSKVTAIKTALRSQKCCLVTVRSEFRKSQKYLRPDYSYPSELSKLLDQPEFQKPFAFEFDPIGQMPFSDRMIVYPSTDTTLPDTFVALHKVKRFDASAERKESSDVRSYFEARINSFWSQLEESSEVTVREAFVDPQEMPSQYSGCHLYCMFAAQNSNDSTPDMLLPRHISAVYFLSDAEIYEDFRDEVLTSQIFELSSQLFEGIALIEKIDSALFQLEGLQIVADLLPQFSDKQLSPADKIAIGIDSLDQLLSQHIVGRTMEGEAPRIFYLNCAFEKTSDSTFFPRLSLYPLVHRRDYRLAAAQVAHEKNTSASKLLLWKYMTSSSHRIGFGRNFEDGIAIDERFADTLEPAKIGTSEFDDWLHFAWRDEPGSADIIHMVQHDTRLAVAEGELNPWDAYNIPADPQKKNRSIVAYVVESEPRDSVNEQPLRGLPRGILAIESQDVAAFSDADISGLKSVLSGFASLIRTVTHQNSPIDYTPQIRSAFRQFIPPDRRLTTLDEDMMLSLVFLAHTLDAFEADLLCKQIRIIESSVSADEFSEYLAKGYDLDLPSLSKVEEVIQLLDPKEDEHLSERQATLHIEERIQSIQGYIRSLEELDGLQRAVTFLEACSENFLWANYKYSFGQALGDRIHREIPEFYFMRPGYSASQMFMAIVKDELKQVVKLSSKSKLDRERERYLKYVRYRVVNAARIPVTAYAFDSDGQRGRDRFKADLGDKSLKENYQEPYGVLVSDLVFARDPENTSVSTLVSTVVDHFRNRAAEPPESASPDIGLIADQLGVLLGENLELWKAPTEPLATNKLHEAVRLAFRLPVVCVFEEPKLEELHSANQTTRQDANRRQHLYETYKQFEIFCHSAGRVGENLISKWGADKLAARPMQGRFVEALSQIAHGDLNARNLAWADGLDTFFLIDFEHVGDSLAGTDECRLAVNLLTDLFGSYLETLDADGPHVDQQDSVELKKITSEIDSALDKLPALASALALGGSRRVGGILRSNTISKCREDSGEELWWLISRTLNLLPIDRSRKDNDYAQTHNLLWSYCLFCSSLKEYEYSLRNITPDDLSAVMMAANKLNLKLYELDALELYNFLWNNGGLGQNRTRDMLGKFMRYFISGKLLYRIIHHE